MCQSATTTDIIVIIIGIAKPFAQPLGVYFFAPQKIHFELDETAVPKKSLVKSYILEFKSFRLILQEKNS